jgi:hypothetical protein
LGQCRTGQNIVAGYGYRPYLNGMSPALFRSSDLVMQNPALVSVVDYFLIPAPQVVELGTKVEL